MGTTETQRSAGRDTAEELAKESGDLVAPDAGEIEGAADLLRGIEALLRGELPGKLVGPDGYEVTIPASALTALRQVVTAMARGQAVTVVPHDYELTTQEAADLLHVSRPHLIKLLDRGDLPHHRTSDDPKAHRRVLLSDVMSYKQQRQQRRRSQLAELSQMSQDLLPGGYR